MRLVAVLALTCVRLALAQPDIFLVTIDTLRADHVQCFGDSQIRTPALDSLARDGIRFSEAFTPSPITTPSHASILTGLYPSHHGVTAFGARLAPTHPTWAKLLKAHGYQTEAFIGSVVLDSKSLAPGLDNGFDFYDNFPEPAATSASRWGSLERRGMDVVQHAESWIISHPARRRFVWLHLYDPHDPYEPPEPFFTIYKDRLYDGEIAYADSALLHFLAFLKRRGSYANSLIIVTGDHGEGLGDHGEDTHGIFLYESTTHVPLIVKLPSGRGAGTSIDAVVRTTDILPTALAIANIPAPAKFDGESLLQYVARASSPSRTALAETDYPIEFGWAPLRSLRTGEFQFIEAPRPELYDLKVDPEEDHNIYEPWNGWVQNARGTLARLRTSPVMGVQPETVAELRALGYIGHADAGSSTNVPEPSLLPDPKDKIEQHNLLHRAMLASQTGHVLEARAALTALLRLDSASFLALRQLGELELKDRRYSEAAEYLQRAQASRSDDPASMFDLGEALEQMHKLPGARDVLEASLKLLPGQFEARLLLGQVCLEMNDSNCAADQFEASLLLRPSNREAKLGLARAYIALKKSSEALRKLLELAKIDQRNPEVFRLLAEVYANLGQPAEEREAEEKYELLQKGK